MHRSRSFELQPAQGPTEFGGHDFLTSNGSSRRLVLGEEPMSRERMSYGKGGRSSLQRTCRWEISRPQAWREGEREFEGMGPRRDAQENSSFFWCCVHLRFLLHHHAVSPDNPASSRLFVSIHAPPRPFPFLSLFILFLLSAPCPRPSAPRCGPNGPRQNLLSGSNRCDNRLRNNALR
jgi:hypothetical protein